MPERMVFWLTRTSVFVLGEVREASRFDRSSLRCQWRFVYDAQAWNILDSEVSGVTQLASSDCDRVVWNHPFDVHFSFSNLTGWPKLFLEVFFEDTRMQRELVGYGLCYVPTVPGVFELSVPTYRPAGTLADDLRALLLGNHTVFKDPSVVYNSISRPEVKTLSSGVIELRLQIIHKGLVEGGVLYS